MLDKNIQNVIKDIRGDEAWEILSANIKAHLIDVRTDAELDYVGYPIIDSIKKEVIFLPWMHYPAYDLNTDFTTELVKIIPAIEDILIFICKAGGRSKQAAQCMNKIGYKNCFNIIDGFEGSMDSQKQRGKVSGWKFLNLPWEQK